jgi:hypothetical protein
MTGEPPAVVNGPQYIGASATGVFAGGGAVASHICT